MVKPIAPPPPQVPVAEAPPRPLEGVISWNMNTSCNYRCSYCTQRFLDDRGRWARDTPRFLEAFGRLPGTWEIKLSGGEPFQHPTLLEIVQGLVDLGHRISVVTNFSASDSRLERFLDITHGRLRVLSASLHLEYVSDLDAFVARAQRVRERLAGTGSICVTCVATAENLPRLEALHRRFTDAGVTFKVQPEKQERDVVAYAPEALELLRRLGGHNLTGEVAWDFYGRPCWAGARYFILDHLGEAYRCYPARRYRIERLGSFLEPDFRLHDEPALCRYHYCNCTVPISRGMMRRESAEPEDEDV
jgi:MoaA/NifB/PqqE/SkfB family radical SAM enzyme